MGDFMIELIDVSTSYVKNIKVIDKMNLKIEEGEIFGFIGSNGAGKTTTMEMITGILGMDEGKILIDGIDISKEPLKAKSRFGFVPDSPDAFEKLSGLEYLNFIADVYNVSSKDRMGKIEKLSKEFGIYDDLKNRIQSYSHGMKQKLIIISVLIHEPKNWILDEPMTGLDPKSSFILKNLMKEHSKKGNTVFFSTHVLEVAEKLCDRIAIIEKGKLVYIGTIEKLKESLKTDAGLEEAFLKIIEK
mgnify:CR=1 FL=1